MQLQQHGTTSGVTIQFLISHKVMLGYGMQAAKRARVIKKGPDKSPGELKQEVTATQVPFES